ncbi:MAG: DNA-binding protein [Omnitrophica WOR_2 bacterium RIFCSPHIGHO2_02_FULL_68_15]|nr:MAG: DNA-binding protein [Omnitrophica WOR_2 bacterium RIFCSPHIGHO2_02_FULL_68_15]
MAFERTRRALSIILPERVERRIHSIRGHRVILDLDLASLYGVATKRLNEQVKRNAERFPEDFMFRLTEEEAEVLRSQIATSSERHGGRRYQPYAFTEHGAIMAANVLNNPRAVKVSILVVRAFVRLRQVLATHRELAHKLDELERQVGTHDEAIRELMTAVRRLMELPQPERRQIGFHVRDGRGRYETSAPEP